MTDAPQWAPIQLRPGLVVDPRAKHFRAMKQAIWLFLYLISVADPQGIALIQIAIVSKEMGLPEDTIRSWLGQLRKNGYLDTLQQGEGVQVTISRWDAPAEVSKESGQSPTPKPPTLVNHDQSSNLATALGGDPDDPMWDSILAQHSKTHIQATLDRVKKVPPQQIRKSRVALFLYLLRNNQDKQ